MSSPFLAILFVVIAAAALAVACSSLLRLAQAAPALRLAAANCPEMKSYRVTMRELGGNLAAGNVEQLAQARRRALQASVLSLPTGPRPAHRVRRQPLRAAA